MLRRRNAPGHRTVDNLVLAPRDVAFDWTSLPTHWVPGQPFVTHTINVLHLLLPAGERWFVDVFTQALPFIRDDKLREEVLGFIGQETIHARSHQSVLDHWKDKGIDTDPYVRQIDWMFFKALGDRDLISKGREWLIERLSIIAAIEHITAMLGNWALNSPALDATGADPTMLDLLRWHGAEEVEHRAVAFDLFTHLDGRYLRRLRGMTVTWPIMLWLWARGVVFLMRTDPELAGRRCKARWRYYFRASRRHLLPPANEIVRGVLRYHRPRYHPLKEFSTGQAVAYLAGSPAATAAAV